MGIVDAVCQHVGERGICGKPIRWQAGDPMRCAEHGGKAYHLVEEPEKTGRWLLDIQIKRDNIGRTN